MIPTWGAAFGANAIFNSAEFRADLTHSAVPDKAAPGTTATFTRATAKTVENNDGNLVTLASGEIGFPGARRVRNHLTKTEDLTHADWTKSNVTVTSGVSDPNGGTSAFTLTATAGNGEFYQFKTIATGNTLCGSIYIRRRTGTGTVSFDVNTSATTTVTTSWTRIEKVAVQGGIYGYCYIKLATNGDAIDVWHPQLEDVTAQTTQTAGEYVSVGVPSDWAGDELVTNGTFDTATTGWSAAVGATLSIDTARLKITNDGTGANAGEARQTLTTVVGTKYVLAATGTTGSAQASIKVGTSAGAQDLLTNSLCDGFNTYTFTATSTTSHLTLRVNAVAAGAHVFYDNISVKPAYYHGSFVDGVKCFPTDLAGNALTTMLGYSAEGARTNLCLQSSTFGAAPWGDFSGAMSKSQNATGPDGVGNSAWTLTDDSVAGEAWTQTIALANATEYCCSVFIKKTSGALTSYPAFTAYNAGRSVGVCVNTTAGTATAITAYQGATIGTTSNIVVQNFNTDYWRVSFSFTTNAAANWLPTMHPAFNADGTGAESLSATGSAVFYGVQVELGSFASSYISTGAASASRAADVLTYSSGDIPNLKTLMAGFRCAPGVNTGAARVVASLSPGASNFAEYIDAGSFQLGATDFWFQGIDNSVGQWATQCSNTYTPGTSAKAASSWATNDIKMSFNGVAQTADTVATMPTVTTLYVGSGSGVVQLNGNVGPIYGWTRNQSQSELNAVTA